MSSDSGGHPTAAKEQAPKAKCSKLWIGLISVTVVLVSITVGLLYSGIEISSTDDIKNVDLGEFSLLILQKFDNDQDGKLDAEEFIGAVQHILSLRSSKEEDLERPPVDLDFESKEILYDVNQVINESSLNRSPNDITLHASLKPLDMSTMSKANDDPAFHRDEMFSLLKDWKMPNIPTATFPASLFKFLLPAASNEKSLGKPYFVFGKTWTKFDGSLNHGRFWPPSPQSDAEKAIFHLLGMFHPRPFATTRFGPKGSIACVRAYNSDYIDVAFRIHAEFQINDVPLRPFWFTPAQFAGNIVMKRDGSEVYEFNLFLPTTKKLNIDMEWITGIRENYTRRDDMYTMEVDIGFMPELSLNSEESSRRGLELDWENEISMGEARSHLEKEFYPFKNVAYVPFNQTVELASENDKLIHVVLLWGSLDDQSC